MKTTKILHREQSRIKIEFPYNQFYSAEVKKIKNAAWSRTHKAWLIDDDAESWIKLKLVYSLNPHFCPAICMNFLLKKKKHKST